jgi:hypothetical protein
MLHGVASQKTGIIIHVEGRIIFVELLLQIVIAECNIFVLSLW